MNKSIMAIGLSAISFSFFPLLNSVGLNHASPVFFSLTNLVFTVLFAGVALVVMMGGPKPFFAALGGFRDLPGNLKVVSFFSGTSVYLGNVFFLYSLSLMSKAGATVIMEMWPILAIFVSAALIEKSWHALRPLDYVMMAVCIFGVIMITGAEKDVGIIGFLADPLFIFSDYEFMDYVGVAVAFLSAYCYAYSGVSRARFTASMDEDFTRKYFSHAHELAQSLYIYLITLIVGFPFAIALVLGIESDFHFASPALLPSIANGAVLTVTSVLYSYAILHAASPNINILWYIAPLLAAIWLYIFGFTALTSLLMLGGALILLANVVTVLTQKPDDT